MIQTFKHKGLRELFQRGATRRVEQSLQRRCHQILTVINNAANIHQINVPGYALHQLKPFTTWAVKVNGPWRITFEFKNGSAYDVDLEQYH